MRRHLVSVIRSAALLGLLLLPASFAGKASAQEEEGGGKDPLRSRFYLGLGLVDGIPDFSDYNSTNRDAESTFGFDLRAGYRWHWVAAEFAVQYYSDFDLTDSLTKQHGEMRGVTAGPAVKVYPPHLLRSFGLGGFLLDFIIEASSGRIQPYALGGLGLLYLNSRDDLKVSDGINFMLRPGGGLEVELLPGMIIFAEGSYVFGIGTKHDLIPVVGGVQLHF